MTNIKSVCFSLLLQVCAETADIVERSSAPCNTENRVPSEDNPCYANCPLKDTNTEASQENIPQDTDTTPTSSLPIVVQKPLQSENLGAMIMKQYEQDRQRARENLHLPEVSLLDVDASLEDIERERREIIGSQTVKAKRINSWIKEGQSDNEEAEESERCPLPRRAQDAQQGTAECVGSWTETEVNLHWTHDIIKDTLESEEDTFSDGKCFLDSRNSKSKCLGRPMLQAVCWTDYSKQTFHKWVLYLVCSSSSPWIENP